MDKEWAQEVAKDAAEKARKGANEAVQRAETDLQSTLDQGKSMVQDLANRASETGRQAMGRAGEFIEGVAPQAKEVASNLYDQGSRSGEYLRQYVAQQPLTALLIAGAIGYTLAYLIHRA
jgi:ElaB/YqjD/DUF883 family membrane-anchored ribosome-binding protein